MAEKCASRCISVIVPGMSYGGSNAILLTLALMGIPPRPGFVPPSQIDISATRFLECFCPALFGAVPLDNWFTSVLPATFL